MKIIIIVAISILSIINDYVYTKEIYNLIIVGENTLQNSATYTVIWDYDDTTGTIDLLLWDGANSSWSVIDTNINGTDLSYDWEVNATPGDMYRIKAVASESSSTYTMTTGYFTIEEEPIQKPNNVITESSQNIIAKTLRVFPNPANTEINVEVDAESINTIFIWDSRGYLNSRYNSINFKSYQIPIQSYNPGQYYMECIMASGKRLTAKFIVIH